MVAVVAEKGPQQMLVGVNVNDRSVDEFARILRGDADRFYATAEQLAKWRLRLPSDQPLLVDGREYYPLQPLGVTSRLDQERQMLFVSAPPSAFVGSVLDLYARKAADAMAPAPGLFLNHDFQWSYTNGAQAVAGLAELGFFSKAGVLTTRFVGNTTRSPLLYRLDTQFVRDFPGRMATLTIGDGVSAAAPGTRQVRYGGVRWASKFSTQPAFLPFALPTLRGEAVQPSTVDIYVNNVHTTQQSVDTGPFSIPNVPIITDRGDIRMVVTDVVGRQQIITQSYIAARELLRKGVDEYAYEAGSLRRGFGTPNSGYDSLFLAGTHRRGMTDLLTLNLRGEILAGHQTFGVGGDYAFQPVGLVGGGVAVSRAHEGAGMLVYGQLQHRARSFGFSTTVQAASSQFRQLGLLSGERPAKIVGQLQISHALGSRGSASFGFLHRRQRDSLMPSPNGQIKPEFSAFTTSVGFRLKGSAFLGISANYSPGAKQGMTVGISLIVPLGPRQALVANSDLQEREVTSTIDVSRQAPVGNGYGYRARTSLGDTQRSDAGLWLQGSRGIYGFEASRHNGKVNWRLTEKGGLVLLKKHLLLSRWLDDSFALVEVPNARGVKVFANNQLVATTGHSGLALIPRLVAYDRNTIRLDDSGVPLALGMDFGEKTVVPWPRSGMLVQFAASKVEGALLALVTEDGGFVPLGAQVTVNGDSELLQVAFRGEVFAPKLLFPAMIQVRWETGRCQAAVPSAPGNEPMPRIGPIVCKGY